MIHTIKACASRYIHRYLTTVTCTTLLISDVKAIEIVKKIAEQWRVLTPDQKRVSCVLF